MERSAEYYRGRIAGLEERGIDCVYLEKAVSRARALLAAAEAREAEEPNICDLAVAEELDMLAAHIQQYIGPDDARDDIRRICYNRAKDLRRNAHKPREAAKPTAAEVIASCEVAIERAQGYPSSYESVHAEAYGANQLIPSAKKAITEAEDAMREALAIIARWKEGQHAK